MSTDDADAGLEYALANWDKTKALLEDLVIFTKHDGMCPRSGNPLGKGGLTLKPEQRFEFVGQQVFEVDRTVVYATIPCTCGLQKVYDRVDALIDSVP